MSRLLPPLLLGLSVGLSSLALAPDLAAQAPQGSPPAAAPPPAAPPQAAPPQAAPPQAAPPAPAPSGAVAPPAPPPGASYPPPAHGASPPGHGAPPPGYGYPPPPPGYYYPPGYAYPIPLYVTSPAEKGPPMERRSTGMMVGGIVLTGAGALAMLFGTALWIRADNPGYSCNEFECTQNDTEGAREGSIALLAAGAAGLGLGIVLWVRGAKNVPVQPAPSAALVVGPGRLTLRGQF